MRGKKRTKTEKEKIVRSLKPYFELGYSLNKACVLAKIPSSTVNDILNKNEVLRMEMEASQNLINTQARKVIANKIKKGDVGLSKWWLEKIELPSLEKNKEEINIEDDKEIERLEKLLYSTNDFQKTT